MEQKGFKKKTIPGILGLLLIIGNLKNIAHLNDWSTTQMVGYNTWTLIAIFGGAYLAYRYWPFNK